MMVVEECVLNGDGMNCESLLIVPVMKRELVDNGFSYGTGNGTAQRRLAEGLQTYKRRRNGKAVLGSKMEVNGRICSGSATEDQIKNYPKFTALQNNLCEQDSLLTSAHEAANGSDYFRQRHWRNLVMENIYKQVSDSEGGIRDCILEALKVHAQSDCSTSKASVDKNGHNHPTEAPCNAFSDAAAGVSGVNSSLSESNHHSMNEMCQRAFFSLIVSEKFAALCKLLLENFQGIKVDSFFDYNLINTRMKSGAYDCTPMLFATDIQKVWEKIQNIGKEMVSLSENLLDISRASYSKQLRTGAPDVVTKQEQVEAQTCEEKANDGDCLTRDSHDEMYHENCVVCVRLKAGTTDDFHECEESNEDSESSRLCKICETEAENCVKFRTCSHPFCPSKYYHVRCLTNKQLKSYGPKWYCPSCLCRVCLNDKDDHKIVLCDGCDHAYHIYCMQPPLVSIPRGKWFCKECNAGIQEIHKKRRAYESVEKSSIVMLEKAEGVDMLLNAANTLNIEERFGSNLTKH